MLQRAFEPWHLLIPAGILTVLFGAKRLPGSARSIGQSMRILRSEVAASRGEPADTAPDRHTPSAASGLPNHVSATGAATTHQRADA